MGTEKIVKTLRFSPSLVDRVQELADKNNRSFANMVETILLKFNPEEHRDLV